MKTLAALPLWLARAGGALPKAGWALTKARGAGSPSLTPPRPCLPPVPPRPPHPLARASWVSPHQGRVSPPQGKVSRLTLAPPRSPMLTDRHLTLTHLRPLDQSPHLLRVHFWPLASAAEMGSHGS